MAGKVGAIKRINTQYTDSQLTDTSILIFFGLVSNSWGAQELPARGAAFNREHSVTKGQLAQRGRVCKPPVLASKGEVSSEGLQSGSMTELQDRKLPRDYMAATVQLRRAIPRGAGAPGIKGSCPGGESKGSALCPSRADCHFHSVNECCPKPTRLEGEGAGSLKKSKLNCSHCHFSEPNILSVSYSKACGVVTRAVARAPLTSHPEAQQGAEQGTIRVMCLFRKERVLGNSKVS